MSSLRTKLPSSLKEIRFHICQLSEASNGTRDFIKNNYLKLKSENPNFPFLVRETQGVQAKLIGRFDKGIEKKIILDGLNEKQIVQQFHELLASDISHGSGRGKGDKL